MTDTYHTLSELNILFQEVLLTALGYDKTASPDLFTDAAYAAVRMSWPTEGAPAFKATEDVVFAAITENDDQINRTREVKYTDVDLETVNEETSYTQVLSLGLVLYGPNSFDNALRIRDGVYWDDIARTLAAEKIYLIPDIAAPRRVPERFQSRWWERTDMEIMFNAGIKKNRSIKVINAADIDIYNYVSKQATISIVEENYAATEDGDLLITEGGDQIIF
jgi:hypothetical protein